MLQARPCTAFGDAAGELDGGAVLGIKPEITAQCRYRTGGAALVYHVARAAFAAATLQGNAELELNLVKAHASACMARDIAVRDAAADTDDHGGGVVRSALEEIPV